VTPWSPKPGSGEEFDVGDAESLVNNRLVLTRSEPDVVTRAASDCSSCRWVTGNPRATKFVVCLARSSRVWSGSWGSGSAGITSSSSCRQWTEGESRSGTVSRSRWTPLRRARTARNGEAPRPRDLPLLERVAAPGSRLSLLAVVPEGFTEYAANVSMLAAGLISPVEFLGKLSDHVGKYRTLATTLEAGGSRKGRRSTAAVRSSHSRGTWIRHATGGKRDLGDFFTALWHRTERGGRPYAWRTFGGPGGNGPRDWDAFFRAHIQGGEPLPLDEILPLAGLRLEPTEEGTPSILIDPSASAASKTLWQALVKGL